MSLLVDWVPRVPVLQSTASHKQMNALFAKNLDYKWSNDSFQRWGWLLRYLKDEKELDVFHTGLVSVRIISLLTQQCCIVEKTPVSQLTQEWGWRVGHHCGTSLSVRGVGRSVTVFFPRAKESYRRCLREILFSLVSWRLVRYKNTTGRVLWTFGIAVSMGIWLVLSHMGHFEGKLSLSPLYHWDKVLAKYGSD